MKKLLPSGFILIYLFSNCLTSNEKVFYKPAPQIKSKISAIEENLLRIKFEGNPGLVKQTESDINDLASITNPIKNLKAEFIGFYALIELSKNNLFMVKKYISDIEKIYDKEESLYILKAELAKNYTDKKNILLAGLKKADSNNIIKLYLADIDYNNLDFKSALALYDDAFKELPEYYQKYYSKKRDISYRLTDINLNKNNLSIIIKEKISFSDFFDLLTEETNLFKNITDREKLEKIENILKNDIADLSGLIKRKDAAFLIIKAISLITDDNSILNKYKPDYDYSRYVESKPSPIKDIRKTDRFYNACMVAVENEWMNLLDGNSFFPDNNLSGIETYDIINKLNQSY